MIPLRILILGTRRRGGGLAFTNMQGAAFRSRAGHSRAKSLGPGARKRKAAPIIWLRKACHPCVMNPIWGFQRESFPLAAGGKSMWRSTAPVLPCRFPPPRRTSPADGTPPPRHASRGRWWLVRLCAAFRPGWRLWRRGGFWFFGGRRRLRPRSCPRCCRCGAGGSRGRCPRRR